MRALDALLAAFSLLLAAQALSPAEWRSQSIYQVVTDRFARADGSTTAHCDLTKQDYCGGSWKGIVKELDYIQGMGFTAVSCSVWVGLWILSGRKLMAEQIWISPVVKNIVNKTADGAAYHGYWADDIYQLNANFGTVDDLKDLSDELHARGMVSSFPRFRGSACSPGIPEFSNVLAYSNGECA
jgi:alpha-amylase